MNEHSQIGMSGAGGVAAGGTNRAGAAGPGVAGSIGSRDALTEVLRQGASDLLAKAVDLEVAEWIERHSRLVDDQGRRQVVRNGFMPPSASASRPAKQPRRSGAAPWTDPRG